MAKERGSEEAAPAEGRSAQFEMLFAYHWHVAGRLIACAARLDEADVRAMHGHGHGSIHDTLFHVLFADNGWRQALELGRREAPLQADDYPTLAALQAGFDAEQAAWSVLLDALGARGVGADTTVTGGRGDAFTFPRWQILQHVVQHGMQHFAEVAERLSEKGQSPGDIDFIYFSGA